MVRVSIVKRLVTWGQAEEAGSEPHPGMIDINRHLSCIWSESTVLHDFFYVPPLFHKERSLYGIKGKSYVILFHCVLLKHF